MDQDRDKDIRWQQRFENFEKSFHWLEKALQIEKPNLVEKAGAIQFFEVTFELSWKMLKDYLQFQGYDIKSPRDAIKTGFSYGLITNGESWLSALNDRHLTVHTYDEVFAEKVYGKIKSDYFPHLKQLHQRFKAETCSD